jgi:acid phosphatase family membrane protein YuiD
VSALLNNTALLAVVTAMFIAQVSKVPFLALRRQKWNWRAILRPGGMPSSHSAVAAALTTVVGFEAGLGSALFAVCLVLTAFIVYDAAGSRRAAMRQARALNRLIDAFLAGNPEPEFERVVELLGHEPSEVLGGLLLGVVIGWLYAGNG